MDLRAKLPEDFTLDDVLVARGDETTIQLSPTQGRRFYYLLRDEPHFEPEPGENYRMSGINVDIVPM